MLAQQRLMWRVSHFRATSSAISHFRSAHNWPQKFEKRFYRQQTEAPYLQEWNDDFLTKRGIQVGTVIEVADRSLIKCGLSKGITPSKKSLIVKLTSGKELLVDARQVIDVWPSLIPPMTIEQLKEIEESSWMMLPNEPLQAFWRRQMLSRRFDLPIRSTGLAQELFCSQSPPALLATVRLLNEPDNFYVTRSRSSFEGYRILPRTGVNTRLLNRFTSLIGSLKRGEELPPRTIEEQRLLELLEAYHLTALSSHTRAQYSAGFDTCDLILQHLNYPSSPEGATILLKDINYWAGSVPVREFPSAALQEASELFSQKRSHNLLGITTDALHRLTRFIKGVSTYVLTPSGSAEPFNYGISISDSNSIRTVMLHITDVARFLRTNSALDAEAALRFSSKQQPLFPLAAVQALQLHNQYRNYAITIALELEKEAYEMKQSEIFLSNVQSAVVLPFFVVEQAFQHKGNAKLGKHMPLDLFNLRMYAKRVLSGSTTRREIGAGDILKVIETAATTALQNYLIEKGIPFPRETSGLRPLNSFPDVVLQRQLHAAITNQALPYTQAQVDALYTTASPVRSEMQSPPSVQIINQLSEHQRALTGRSDRLITCVVEAVSTDGQATVTIPALSGYSVPMRVPRTCRRGVVVLAEVQIHDGVLHLHYQRRI